MALRFDNSLSWMDIVAIAGSAITAIFVIFNAGERITMNELEIKHIKQSVQRVEVRASEDNDKIIQQLRDQNSVIKEIKTESAEGRHRIEQKLDRLIDRFLGPTGAKD